MQRSRVPGVTWIVVSSIFFGVMAVLARLLAGRVPSAEVVTVRFGIGVVGCLLLFAARRRGPDLHQWKFLLLRGALGGFAVLTYFFAIERLGAATATVLNQSSPIHAALFAAWFLGETSTRLKRISLLLATAGAMLVAFSNGSKGYAFLPDVGAIAGLASAISGGAAITTIRRLRDETDALTIFFAFCVVGLFMSAPLAAQHLVVPDAGAWWLLIGVGVLSMIAQLLFTLGMGFTTATTGSATTQLVPVVSWTLALTFLEEPVTLVATVGAMLTIGGVLLGLFSPAARR